MSIEHNNREPAPREELEAQWAMKNELNSLKEHVTFDIKGAFENGDYEAILEHEVNAIQLQASSLGKNLDQLIDEGRADGFFTRIDERFASLASAPSFQKEHVHFMTGEYGITAYQAQAFIDISLDKVEGFPDLQKYAVMRIIAWDDVGG